MRALPTCGVVVVTLALCGACSSAFVGEGTLDSGLPIDGAVDTGAPDAAKVPLDAADASAARDANLPDTADAAPLPYRVFVTSGTDDGKPGNGGLAGADELCRQASLALPVYDPTRRWLAYLAANDQHPATRFGDATGGWVRVDGVLVFASRSALLAGGLPNVAIGLTELGVAPTNGNLVWTGMANNSPAGNTCGNWQNASPLVLGRVGNATRIDQSWQSDDNANCGQDRHLFCFEQPASN